jgi:hypothetical protein
MITKDHIKELKNITYDREELERFYHSIKHKAINYIERHTDYIEQGAEDSPYFRCICSKCLPTGKHQHSGDNHKFIRHLERFKNLEIDRLTKELEYITKTNTPNYPVIWIYGPGFELPPHRDFARTCSIMVPILPAEGGATVHLYEDNLPIVEKENYKTVEHNDNYLLGTHVYSTKHPTVLNANRVIHGVRNTNTTRVFINFSGYIDWNLIT